MQWNNFNIIQAIKLADTTGHNLWRKHKNIYSDKMVFV